MLGLLESQNQMTDAKSMKHALPSTSAPQPHVGERKGGELVYVASKFASTFQRGLVDSFKTQISMDPDARSASYCVRRNFRL